MGQIQTITTNKTSWVNIMNASEKEIEFLSKKYKFNPLDLEDSYMRKKAQRPKLFARDKYIFLVLLFPIFDKKNKAIKAAEIDIFITKNSLITIDNYSKGYVNNFFKKLQQDKSARNTYLNLSPALLLYEILNTLYLSIFPMLDHVNLEIEKAEANIFANKVKRTVKELFIIKRDIVNFKKIMQVHKNVLRKLLASELHFVKTNQLKLDIYYNDLIDYTKNIWDTLENYQQTVNDLERSNKALADFQRNEIIKVLTLFSVIIFPLTLLATLFAMDVDFMPIRGSYLDFWKIIGIMTIITAIMIYVFKRKKWL